jgi:hypothetical protein
MLRRVRSRAQAQQRLTALVQEIRRVRPQRPPLCCEAAQCTAVCNVNKRPRGVFHAQTSRALRGALGRGRRSGGAGRAGAARAPSKQGALLGTRRLKRAEHFKRCLTTSTHYTGVELYLSAHGTSLRYTLHGTGASSRNLVATSRRPHDTRVPEPPRPDKASRRRWQYKPTEREAAMSYDVRGYVSLCGGNDHRL